MEINKIVYLVRHGQSEANTLPVFQGLDSPLSEVGITQAQSIANRVSKLAFESLISSPLQRARETAKEIEKTSGIMSEFSDLFTERIKPTNINGKPHTDDQANIIWRDRERSLFTPNMRVEDGENFDDIISRADNALNLLLNKTEKSILVVTHGYFLRTIVARVLLGNTLNGESFRTFQKSVGHENTGLTILRYNKGFEEDPKWNLWIYNDHAHLAD
ncbi:MAG: histidine phosphatase family protein [Candidatus Paceibacteria bacterium]